MEFKIGDILAPLTREELRSDSLVLDRLIGKKSKIIEIMATYPGQQTEHMLLVKFEEDSYNWYIPKRLAKLYDDGGIH